MAELFGIDRTSILRHIRNIYKSEELEEFSTCAKIAQVRTEGKRRIQRDIPYYSLDMIISVGYRVNSRKATVFRQGKLCVSYPAVEIHEPVCYNYGLECDSRIAWPFGYGLSYASFEYSALQMERQVAPMPTRSRSVWM
ncbi:MAG: RhuM family protein [Bacteroides sp.]